MVSDMNEYCHHREIMNEGTQMEVVEVGTCTRRECVIKVITTDAKLDDTFFEKVTSSKVFVGDLVMCGFKTCYKD